MMIRKSREDLDYIFMVICSHRVVIYHSARNLRFEPTTVELQINALNPWTTKMFHFKPEQVIQLKSTYNWGE